MRGHIDLLIDRARELLGLDGTWEWCALAMIPPNGHATAVKIELGQKKGEKFVKPFRSIHLSLDEEAANLIRYQQMYQACGKMIEIASKLFDSLLAL